MSDSQLQSPSAVAEQLNISPDQLRRWTKEFAAQLSASAVGTGAYRYTAEDVQRLRIVRDLFTQGKSFDEVSRHLSPDSPTDRYKDYHESPIKPDAVEDDPQAVVIQPEESSAQAPTALVLREMLQGFAAGQEAILNSQQTNRNLMGVVIQDNFNLKEENARLRERMMKLEQELNELRRAQSEYRQQIEQRLRQMEQKNNWLSRWLGF